MFRLPLCGVAFENGPVADLGERCGEPGVPSFFFFFFFFFGPARVSLGSTFLPWGGGEGTATRRLAFLKTPETFRAHFGCHNFLRGSNF